MPTQNIIIYSGPIPEYDRPIVEAHLPKWKAERIMQTGIMKVKSGLYPDIYYIIGNCYLYEVKESKTEYRLRFGCVNAWNYEVRMMRFNLDLDHQEVETREKRHVHNYDRFSAIYEHIKYHEENFRYLTNFGEYQYYHKLPDRKLTGVKIFKPVSVFCYPPWVHGQDEAQETPLGF